MRFAPRKLHATCYSNGRAVGINVMMKFIRNRSDRNRKEEEKEKNHQFYETHDSKQICIFKTRMKHKILQSKTNTEYNSKLFREWPRNISQLAIRVTMIEARLDVAIRLLHDHIACSCLISTYNSYINSHIHLEFILIVMIPSQRFISQLR